MMYHMIMLNSLPDSIDILFKLAHHSFDVLQGRFLVLHFPFRLFIKLFFLAQTAYKDRITYKIRNEQSGCQQHSQNKEQIDRFIEDEAKYTTSSLEQISRVPHSAPE